MSETSNHISTTSQDYLGRVLEEGKLQVFLKNYFQKKGSPKYISISLPFDHVDPLAVLETIGKPGEFQYYWEHPVSGLAIAAGKALHIIREFGENRFDKTNRQTIDLENKVASFSEIPHSLSGMNVFGGASFFSKPLSGAWSGFGNASFVLPKWVIVRDGKFTMLTLSLPYFEEKGMESFLDSLGEEIQQFVSLVSDKLDESDIINGTSDARLQIHSTRSRDAHQKWVQNVNHAKDLIKNNVFDKIVMAREERLSTDNQAKSTKLLHHLRKDYPDCYSFLYQINDQAAFIGCTPEKLLSVESDRLYTDGLAGSISRGKTATQDEMLSRKLLSSLKDLSEHQYVVDSILEKLESYSSDIDFPDKPGIRKYANVQHLHTPITASLQNTTDVIALLKKLHPTPAVGGYPQEQALPYIQQLEQIERGWYAGPIGWLNHKGRSEFAVAIRSGLIQPNKVRFYAGCGIVEGSDPEAEWKETELKLMPMLSALQHAAE